MFFSGIRVQMMAGMFFKTILIITFEKWTIYCFLFLFVCILVHTVSKVQHYMANSMQAALPTLGLFFQVWAGTEQNSSSWLLKVGKTFSCFNTHKARSLKKYLTKFDVKSTDLSAQTLDLNPFQHLWDELEL